ncbi:MAG: SOS response-associated peptidase [Myxococcales bacterium]
MCGGYELDADPEALISAFRVDVSMPELGETLAGLAREHFPRMQGPIVLTRKPSSERAQAERWLGLSRWGLVPHWATSLAEGDKMFNARAETLEQKPAFREAFRSRRCVVPVSAFYEWHKEGKRSQRFVFRLVGSELPFLPLAGLWASWRAPSGERVGTYAVITVPPNERVAPIHGRMPAVLGSVDAVERWLALDGSPEELTALLVPAPADLLVEAPG